MSDPTQAILDSRPVVRFAPAAERSETAPALARRSIRLSFCDDLAEIENEWRQFEQVADCTVFQTFDWLAAWQRNIGVRRGVRPALIVGRRADGGLLCIIPLAIELGLVRRLTFLGSDLCDYNAPLLAVDFGAAAGDFRCVWAEICQLVQSQAQLGFDLVELTKMPEAVGSQPNPFCALNVGLHPSGAHLTHLKGSWEEFYQAARSSATRRRDRSKRKKLGEIGEVRFVNPQDRDEIARTLDVLIEQKSNAFAHMGVPNLFAPAGHRDFYLDLATNTRPMVHVSRLDVGSIWASTNLGLIFRGCYYYVLASYDDGEVSRFGPGAAHLRDLFSKAIGSGLTVFDFTVGDESYKREWADTTLKLYDYAAAAKPRGWPSAMLILARRGLKRGIKQNPALWRLVSRARVALAALRGARAGGAAEDV